jgi:hypothetical protein
VGVNTSAGQYQKECVSGRRGGPFGLNYNRGPRHVWQFVGASRAPDSDAIENGSIKILKPDGTADQCDKHLSAGRCAALHKAA